MLIIKKKLIIILVFIILPSICFSQPKNSHSKPNTPPIARFEPDVYSTQENNLTVNFSALKSIDKDGTITKYEWDFGDGTKAMGPEVNHTFNGINVYDVILTVTDNQGAKDKQKIEIEVNCNYEDEGDNACFKIMNHEDRIIPASDHEILIALASSIPFISEEQIKAEVYLKNIDDDERINITSISRFEDGKVKIKMSDLLNKVTDQREKYHLHIEGVSIKTGEGKSGTITDIYFASGVIKGKTDLPPSSKLNVESVSRSVKREIVIAKDQSYEIRDLPFDSYLITAKLGFKTKLDLVLALPNQTTNHDITFNSIRAITSLNEFAEINKKVIGSIQSKTSRGITHQLYAPKLPGPATFTKHETKVPLRQSEVNVAYTLASNEEVLQDDILIAIFINNDLVFKNIENVHTSMRSLEPMGKDRVVTNGWNRRAFPLPMSVIKDPSIVRIEMQAIAKRRDNIKSQNAASAILINVD